MSNRKAARALAALLALSAGFAAAQEPRRGARDLVDLSLEQLADILVTSVSRRAETLSQAPAAIYVISREDIRRSGATSLPEALRLAPNLQVARIDSSQYAITARGFNSSLANKLLVLIDGRAVYTPLFSGTFWEVQDVLLEDVERIEVISGPGATLWGANAVNGVINVITRPAAQTQGTFASGGLGSEERQAAVRRGGELENGHYRVYAKAVHRKATALAGGASIGDEADHAQVGFRADWQRAADGFTVQGDLYGGDIDREERDLSGLNLLGRWTRELRGGESLRVQAYYEHTRRHHLGMFKEDLDTVDLELQHAPRPAGDHRLLWGVGLRHHRDRVENSPSLAFLPADRDLNQAYLFVQDEVALRENLNLTVGAKAERNSYTGTEFLPNLRLALQLSPRHLVWTSLARAVRAPSRIDREFFVPGAPPFTIAGGPDFRSEVAKVAEIGYRAQPMRSLSFSVTGFHHAYERLRTLSPAPGGAVVANDLEGTTSGVEAWATYRGADWWRVDAGFVHLDQSLRLREGAVDLQPPAAIGADPDGWWKLRAAFDLAAGWELDVMARYYGELESREVPSYSAVDARLAWRAARDLEVSLLLQNLFDRGHVEWGPGAEFGRAAFLKLRFAR